MSRSCRASGSGASQTDRPQVILRPTRLPPPSSSPPPSLPRIASPSLPIVILIIIMALGTQGYPRNPQLLAPPFSQSPPQSSTNLVWTDIEPVRDYSILLPRFSPHALPFFCPSFLFVSSHSHHFPRKAPRLLALCHHFRLHGTKVVVQPDPPSLIAQRTMQAMRVVQIAMATGSSENPSPS